METLDKIITQLKNWEEEYTTAKEDYNQFIVDYEKSHPSFAKKLKKAWKETNDAFWGIEVNFRKSFKKASQQKEPQRSLDRYQAKVIRKHARKRAIRKYEAIREDLMKKAMKLDDATTEIPNKFVEVKKRYKRARKQKANLARTLKGFLNSNIYKEKVSNDTSDYNFSY